MLLRGRNYDYSAEVSGKIIENVEKEATTIKLSNTAGLSNGDYIILEPKSIFAEIVQITEAVTDDSEITVSATKFFHRVNSLFYRTSYNQIKFYESSEKTGTYTEVSGGTVDMNYTDNFTVLSYPTGDSSYWFKRTFYNSETSDESDLELSRPWQTDTEEMLVTEQEMRTFLQFDAVDYPTVNDIRNFLQLSARRLRLNLTTQNEDVKFIATLLLTKYYILRALATRSLSKGYIQATSEGRTVTKAYQELVLEAENVYQEYKEFLVDVDRREAASTNYMKHNISPITRNEIIDILNGRSNAENAQYARRYDFFWRR